MAYDNETYLAALSKSRADIDRNVANTLAEVSRQRGVNKGQAAQIPGAVKQVATQQTQQADQGLQQAGGALARFGLEQLGRGALQASGQEVRDRMGGMEASFGRASGLLGQGFDEQAMQRQAGVDRIGSQLRTDNQMKRDSYISSRQAEDRDRAFQTEMQRRAAAQQQTGMDHQSSLQAAQIAAQQSQAEQQRQWEERQAMVGMIHQATLANPLLTTPDVVEDLYELGQAPPGMSLNDFANYLGVRMRPAGRPMSGAF